MTTVVAPVAVSRSAEFEDGVANKANADIANTEAAIEMASCLLIEF